MNKALIKKEYLKKIDLLDHYNQKYYDQNISEISDANFDKLKKEILDLEKNYKFLKSQKSPRLKVGYKPSKNFKKITHRVPMLSLANAFTEEDLNNFEKKILNYLDKGKNFEIFYSAEPKIDGISASLNYKNGKLFSGLSRGDGKEGEDITENLKTINDIPKIVLNDNFPKDIDIRGEVFIQNSDFVNLSDKFANPRNAASGSLRQKNSEDTKKIPLKFIAYTFGYEKDMNIKYQSEYLKKLKEWGFKVNPLNKLIKGVKNLIANYQEIEKRRKDLDFDIDGIVYKVNEFEIQKRLGNVSNAPRWAIAHKFSANSGISRIIDIDIQVGRTGALTPVAKIKPINIGGVVVSNATLHNEEEIIRKDIRKNDEVIVERAGDVIPHIVSVNLNKREKNSKKFQFPSICPSCGSKTIKEYNSTTKKTDAVRRCSSEGFECEKVSIEKIKHFVSKEAFNIDGFGKKIVEKFWELNFVRFPQDIFHLDYKKIESLEGWGKQSVNNLKYSIKVRTKISFERFIFSLGIRHIGLENAKLISRYLKSPINFMKLSKNKNFEDFLNIDGIGETQIKSIKNFFSNETNLKLISELHKVLKIDDAKYIKKNGFFANKTFVLTGKMNGVSRAEAKSLIEQNSGSIASNISKKIDFLIVGEKPTKRKIESAKENNIKILNQNDWFKMLKKTS
ncbi:NAD-dependent DNA ligase LigA [Candidatus Pelagibacter sp.]|nr:NAD-dependent DNA ligase LigA [Candidatus Pelagibacter sp.]